MRLFIFPLGSVLFVLQMNFQEYFYVLHVYGIESKLALQTAGYDFRFTNVYSYYKVRLCTL